MGYKAERKIFVTKYTKSNCDSNWPMSCSKILPGAALQIEVILTNGVWPKVHRLLEAPKYHDYGFRELHLK